MKKLPFILLALIAAFSPACFVPINAVYEDACLLRKGDVELQGNATMYVLPFTMFETEDFSFITNYNFGGMAGFGVSDKFNLRFRYEYIKCNWWNNEFDEIFDTGTEIFGWHYIEGSGKFSLIQDKLALSTPLGIYLIDGGNLFVFDPRLIYTYRPSDKFSLSVVPKMHVFFGGGGVFAMPGLSLGLGLSDDLDTWAFRPEVGFDSYFYLGAAVSFYLGER